MEIISSSFSSSSSSSSFSVLEFDTIDDLFESTDSVFEFDVYSNILKENEVFYKSYYGFGIKPSIGFDFKMSVTSRFGIQFDYDISHIGNAEKGGLGNTGGLLTNIFFNFDL